MYHVLYNAAAPRPSPDLKDDVSALFSQIGKAVLGTLTVSASQLTRVDQDVIDGS